MKYFIHYRKRMNHPIQRHTKYEKERTMKVFTCSTSEITITTVGGLEPPP